MRTILLKFAGTLQSWGTTSHFENRRTDFYPSKSAVIGLIAASLGYRRDEDENVQELNKIDFAVRVDQKGPLHRDYQIARKYKVDGKWERTYVTNRYYLEDSVFVVGIGHQDDTFMELIETALRNPWFQPFMGRRSSPPPVDFIISTSNVGVLESLKKCEWQAGKWYSKKYPHKVTLEVYADRDLLDTEVHTYNLRKDGVVSFSQKERKFAFRYESRTSIEVLNKNAKGYSEEHDVFNNIG